MAMTFPMDIISAILTRLPAKSLARFALVSKQWYFFIKSRQFINLHLTHTLSTSTSPYPHRLLVTAHGPHIASSSPGFESESSGFDVSSVGLVSSFPAGGAVIAGVCHGLVLLLFTRDGRGGVSSENRKFTLVLWNPSSDVVHLLPYDPIPAHTRSVTFGFGYDSYSNDYFILRLSDFVCFNANDSDDNDHGHGLGHGHDNVDAHGDGADHNHGTLLREAVLYSLKEGSWRSAFIAFTADMLDDFGHGAVIDNHISHWLFWKYSERRHRIRGFCFTSRSWTRYIPLPDFFDYDDGSVAHDAVVEMNDILNLGVLDGCLCLVTKILPKFDYTYVWVMKEYGVKESWKKLLRISDVSVVGPLSSVPVGYSEGGDELLLRKAKKDGLFWYNSTDKTLKYVPLPRVSADVKLGDAALCVGTLVSPKPDRNNVRDKSSDNDRNNKDNDDGYDPTSLGNVMFLCLECDS
ncbi:hypothetical protein vseg_000072 [Gypsophila vaccaria]